MHQFHSFRQKISPQRLASWNDCGKVFSDELHVSLFPKWMLQRVASFLDFNILSPHGAISGWPNKQNCVSKVEIITQTWASSRRQVITIPTWASSRALFNICCWAAWRSFSPFSSALVTRSCHWRLRLSRMRLTSSDDGCLSAISPLPVCRGHRTQLPSAVAVVMYYII